MTLQERKSLRDWNDLEQYGIISLTGEACGTGQRLLCDLTPDGVTFIESFLSVKIATGNNWNSRQGQIASAMLPHSMLTDLLVYGLLREGYEVVVVADHRGRRWSCYRITGMAQATWEEHRKEWNERYEGKYRTYHGSGTAPGGLRNRHEMSRRVA